MEQAIKSFSKALEDLKTLSIADVTLGSHSAEEGDDRFIVFLCRITKGADATWLDQMKKILTFCNQNDLKVLISKRYFVKGGNIVFAWSIEIDDDQSEREVINTLQALAEFLPSIKKAKAAVYTPAAPKPQAKSSYRDGHGNGEIEILGAPPQRNMTKVSETKAPVELTRRR